MERPLLHSRVLLLLEYLNYFTFVDEHFVQFILFDLEQRLAHSDRHCDSSQGVVGRPFAKVVNVRVNGTLPFLKLKSRIPYGLINVTLEVPPSVVELLLHFVDNSTEVVLIWQDEMGSLSIEF